MLKLSWLKKTPILVVSLLFCLGCHSENKEQEIPPSNSKVKVGALPQCTWIVTFAGWGLEDGEKRIQAYKSVAKKWEMDIELSSRLGTLDSNKYAPSVAKEIMEHNDKAFLCYQERFGKTWQQKFSKEVTEMMGN